MRAPFTPGEWKRDGGYIFAGDGSATVEVAHAKLVTGIKPAERDANARLITAGPRMYELARSLVDDPPACAVQLLRAAGTVKDCDCWACERVDAAREITTAIEEGP